MSKNFELMLQLEKEPSYSSLSTADATFPSPGGTFTSIGPKRWANDEALRLVQQVFILQAHEPPRVVVFAGIDHRSGCSHICASVAETLAKTAGRPVCLVEANFRSPALSEMYGTTNHHGLTDSLLAKGLISSYTKAVACENLWLLSCGPLAADSPSLLNSERLRDRIVEIRKEFKFAIIDAPPLSRYSDAMALSQLSDGLVLIIEADSTRREAASVAVSNLRSVNIPILAAVLNKRTFPIPDKIYRRL